MPLELIGDTGTLREACSYIDQILQDGLHDDAAITEALAIFELCEGDDGVPDDLIAEAKAVLDDNLGDHARVVRLLEKIVDLVPEVGYGADEAAVRRAQPEAGEDAHEEAIGAAATASDGAAVAPGSVGGR